MWRNHDPKTFFFVLGMFNFLQAVDRARRRSHLSEADPWDDRKVLTRTSRSCEQWQPLCIQSEGREAVSIVALTLAWCGPCERTCWEDELLNSGQHGGCKRYSEGFGVHSPTAHWSCGPFVIQFDSLFLPFITPTVHWSYGPLVLQFNALVLRLTGRRVH